MRLTGIQAKLEFSDMELKPYIILNESYGSVSYVTSLAVSSSRFDKSAVHTKEKLYNFYSEYPKYRIVFVENMMKDPHFIGMKHSLELKEDRLRSEHTRIIDCLDVLNSVI